MGRRFFAGAITFVAGCASASPEPSKVPDASSIADADTQSPDVDTQSADVAAGTMGDGSTSYDGADAVATPQDFTDPNPLPCAGMDPGSLCLTGWTITTHPFVGCCIANLSGDPGGKCGVSLDSSACVERKAPGNADPVCVNTDFLVMIGSATLGGSNTGCCQWRTGTCGAVADDLGCVELAQTAFRGKPCHPDYANGQTYP